MGQAQRHRAVVRKSSQQRRSARSAWRRSSTSGAGAPTCRRRRPSSWRSRRTRQGRERSPPACARPAVTLRPLVHVASAAECVLAGMTPVMSAPWRRSAVADATLLTRRCRVYLVPPPPGVAQILPKAQFRPSPGNILPNPRVRRRRSHFLLWRARQPNKVVARRDAGASHAGRSFRRRCWRRPASPPPPGRRTTRAPRAPRWCSCRRSRRRRRRAPTRRRPALAVAACTPRVASVAVRLPLSSAAAFRV